MVAKIKNISNMTETKELMIKLIKEITTKVKIYDTLSSRYKICYSNK